MSDISIINATLDDISKYGVCGYKDPKKEGFPQKFEWLKQRFSEGLVLKILHSESGGTQGMIEYIPGEFCWRPVQAKDYLFIHCIHVGFKKAYKNQGYASQLIDECLQDAQQQNKQGVAVVTRKGSFMVAKDLFIKNGFEIVDSMKPDFELLVKRFNPKSTSPQFIKNEITDQQGVTIRRAFQCPYTVKNVREIVEFAKSEFNIKVNIVDIKSHQEAQKSPNAFGVFCLIINGKVMAEHPISKTRFGNIIRKALPL